MFKTAMATSLVALLATSGLALAQAQKDGAPGGAGGGGAERSGPPSGSGSGAPGSQSGPAADAPGKQQPAPGKNGASKDGAASATRESQKESGKDGPRTGQAPRDSEGKDSSRADRTKADDTKADRAKSADTKSGDVKSDRTKAERDGDRKDAQKSGDRKDDARTGDAAPKAGETRQDTAGTKNGDGARQLSKTWRPEQRTRVRTVFAKHRREAVVNINIQPRVGISIPRSVKLVSIPQDLIVIVPEYREYRYFIVDNVAYIVDPDTFVIVDVIELV